MWISYQDAYEDKEAEKSDSVFGKELSCDLRIL